MKYLKLYEEARHNIGLSNLEFWKNFLHKFRKKRREERKKYDEKIAKGAVYEKMPNIKYLDEYDLERIYTHWIPKRVSLTLPNISIDFKGLEDVEIGDILISFRGYCWLFKPDNEMNYSFCCSATWAYNSPFDWDDVYYIDNMLKEFKFQISNLETPLFIKKKLSRKIRGNMYDNQRGYKNRIKVSDEEGDKKIGIKYK